MAHPGIRATACLLALVLVGSVIGCQRDYAVVSVEELAAGRVADTRYVQVDGTIGAAPSSTADGGLEFPLIGYAAAPSTITVHFDESELPDYTGDVTQGKQAVVRGSFDGRVIEGSDIIIKVSGGYDAQEHDDSP